MTEFYLCEATEEICGPRLSAEETQNIRKEKNLLIIGKACKVLQMPQSHTVDRETIIRNYNCEFIQQLKHEPSDSIISSTFQIKSSSVRIWLPELDVGL